MRTFLGCCLAVGLVLGTGAPAWSQQGLRGPGGSIGGFHLVMMPAIQKELQLDEGQMARAKQVADRMNNRYQQDMSQLKGLTEDEKRKRVVTLAVPHYEEGMKQLRSFLKPAQIERFDQILFQLRGPMAMLEPKVVQTLQVTNEQAHKVAEIVAKAENEQRAVAKAAGTDRTTASVKIEAIAADANEQAAKILSPEQQRTWQRLTGEPFRPDLGGGGAPEKPGNAESATPKS